MSASQAEHEGSIPFTCSTSPRTAYRSRRLFCKSHLSLILPRLLSESNPLTLGFDSVFIAAPGIFFVNATQVGASVVSLAPTFFQKSERTHAAAPPSNCDPLRWAHSWFSHENAGFLFGFRRLGAASVVALLMQNQKQASRCGEACFSHGECFTAAGCQMPYPGIRALPH